ncbi:amp dependent CoA ligase [Lindgomyces ingoldianus]|uniref:Amp dependent CoA ligase n=1 Tax=Lindgomyces ingoldianus TaxID=673940 RepID=A0ACB6QBJ6_9PLEO|nr:amp dependent CoA ligase [Lindgomyces ingoldianus]KAF2463973.1 amp dependent CoA ligase [Lindgomyces ingoldianus]
MVFTAPAWVPHLPFDPPDSVPLHQFQFDEAYGRCPFQLSKSPFTCALSGATNPVLDVKQRVEHLAQGLAKDMGWKPNIGSEWNKVVNIFSLNHIDYMTLTWAIQRLNGICTPASASSTVEDLEFQLRDSQAKAIFTCEPLLPIALQAAAAVGIPENHVYLIDRSDQTRTSTNLSCSRKSVQDLVTEGGKEPCLDAMLWEPGQGARQLAFLCYSSGTSGRPKGVQITHQNMIANVLQSFALDSGRRKLKEKNGPSRTYTEYSLGVLPMSHAYTLTVLQLATYRGDGILVLPNPDLIACFKVISKYRISTLWLVPALIEMILKIRNIAIGYDLTSVDNIVSGAAPLPEKTADALQRLLPQCRIRQGYGLTEASTVVCWTPDHDIWFKSVGSLLPGCEAKIILADGSEVSEHGVPGELFVRSPSISMGYHNDPQNTNDTFVDGWLRTGDQAMVCKSPLGNEHVVITDRIKDLIKVRGHQVSPLELETFLLTHPAVSDCCVVPVPDARSGEVPKAFVVKHEQYRNSNCDEQVLRHEIQEYVKESKADYKRLAGGVEFIEVVPRGPGGKLLRRMLRA